MLKLITSFVTYLCVGPMEAILEFLLLSLENVTKGHWNTYKLTGILSIFPEMKLFSVFVFPFALQNFSCR